MSRFQFSWFEVFGFGWFCECYGWPPLEQSTRLSCAVGWAGHHHPHHQISEASQIFQGPSKYFKVQPNIPRPNIKTEDHLLLLTDYDMRSKLSSWKLIFRLRAKELQLSPNIWWRFRWMIIQKRLGCGISFPAVCFLFCFLEFSFREGFPKMEFFNGICHERGGRSRVPLTIFRFVLPINHLESLPECQNVFCLDPMTTWTT